MVKSEFIVALQLVAHYSGMLEPVCQILQSVEYLNWLDMVSVQNHINLLINQIRAHRETDEEFSLLWSDINDCARSLELEEITMPRMSKNFNRPTHKFNAILPTTTTEFQLSSRILIHCCSL